MVVYRAYFGSARGGEPRRMEALDHRAVRVLLVLAPPLTGKAEHQHHPVVANPGLVLTGDRLLMVDSRCPRDDHRAGDQ